MTDRELLAQARFVSIDPGVHHAGIAGWTRTGELVFARLVRSVRPASTATWQIPEAWAETATAVVRALGGLPLERAVIEIPRVYVASRSRGDRNDLISLAGAAGTITGALLMSNRVAAVHAIYPREWKGQLKKEISAARSEITLSSSEKSRIDFPRDKKAVFDVWDAIGIGLHAFR